jgi:hypothetical protein
MAYSAKNSALAIVIVLAALATACSTAPPPAPTENQFSLVDTSKYKDEQQKSLGRQLAVNDCKSKALAASSAVEKTVAGEVHNRENQLRARDKAAEMYSASFTSCMNGYGYIRSVNSGNIQ